MNELELLLLLEAYKNAGILTPQQASRIDEKTAKRILQYLIDRGYNIGYVDNSTGKYVRTPDGRIGNSTLAALNEEINRLIGGSLPTYENDFRKYYKGASPTYTRVVGRTPKQVQQLGNMYYDYYSKNPQLYAGLLKDKVQAAKVLPYLSDEAKSMLSLYYVEPYLESNKTLPTPEMAKLGLLGSRGTNLQRNWEVLNVHEAQNRFIANAAQQVYDIVGAGLKFMGRLTGGSPDEMGGLTYTTIYNPVTAQKDRVVVPNKTATVSSNLKKVLPEMTVALDEYGHPIMQANGEMAMRLTIDPIQAAAIDMITDPVTLAGSAVRFETDPDILTKTTVRVPGTGYIGQTPGHTAAVLVSPEITGTVTAYGVRQTTAKPSYITIGNRRVGFRGKHGGASNVVATSTPRTLYVPYSVSADINIPALFGRTITDYPIDYVAYKPGFQYSFFDHIPGQTTWKPYVQVAAHPDTILHQLPTFTQDSPEGMFSWGYLQVPYGRDIVYHDANEDEVYRLPTSNTLNIHRAKLHSHGFMPLYYYWSPK